MRRRPRRVLPLAAALCLSLAAAAPLGAEEPERERIALIVSEVWRGPPALGPATLRRLYLGQRTRIGDQVVRPLHLPLGSREREGFSRTVLGRTPEDLEHYWIEQALQGGALPPREVSGSEALLRALRADPDGLGYLALSDLVRADRDGIRVLLVEIEGRSLAPDDPDYPLRATAR